MAEMSIEVALTVSLKVSVSTPVFMLRVNPTNSGGVWSAVRLRTGTASSCEEFTTALPNVSATSESVKTK